MADMNPKFADWYSKVRPEPSNELLTTRWKCVATLQNELDSQLSARISAWVFGVSSDSDDVREILEQTFKTADASFPLSDNENLLTVLAASCLADILDKIHPAANVVALALLCARCRGARDIDGQGPLIVAPEVYLAQQSIKARENAHSGTDTLHRFRGTPAIEIPEAPDLAGGNDWNIVHQNLNSVNAYVQALSECVKQLSAGAKTFQQDTKKAAKRWKTATADSRVPVLQEETEVLWWLFAEHSDCVDKPFNEIAETARPVVFARDLAKRIKLLPPPPTSEAILKKALKAAGTNREADQYKLPDLLESLDHDWRRRHFAAHGAEIRLEYKLMPASAAAIEWNGELGQEDQWLAISKKIGLDPKTSLSLADWSAQFFYEELLAIALRPEEASE
ncbi:GTPase-associated system all-helical protein GASH [Desulfosarcina ovata]|uniref:GTPase-associated system helical domain-containing protein n=1 Tax=Desulfosarcina ovata subsp. ovata TaxID=2752305 RepID=A0A5K8A684_9BACT|nr:GTPase-associated system all-helical protein GASH [Desulfosarcina ovata]BBO88035.1 hypothetical protein DSCOOX_12150 [Desulfosarcina ovata subsp. ovata]